MRSLERSTLLPEIVTEVPAFKDFADAIDQVLWEKVDEPTLLFLDLRNLNRDSDRYILKQGASLIGFSKKNYFLDEERLARAINQFPKFRNQNTTDAYKNFLGFLVRYRMGIDDLYTDDYFGFFSVPQGSLLISDLGERLEETGPQQGWYNTTHVLIRANPRLIFPDSTTPYEDLRALFEAVAPAYAVLEFIGNIANPFHESLQFNVGVVEGHAIEEYRFTYENINLSGSDWARGRDLPVSLAYHAQSKVQTGRVLLTGGLCHNYKGEKIALYLDLSKSRWLQRDIPFADTAVVTKLAYDKTSAKILAGSSLGELSVSSDGGDTWTKVWSPFYDEREVIVGLEYSEAQKTFIALGDQGYYIRSQDPTIWTGAFNTLGETCTGLVCGPVYIALAASGYAHTSLDGVTWTRTLIQEGFVPFAGCYDPDRSQYLIVGKCGKGFFTTDGRTFTEVNVGVGDYDLTWAQYSVEGQTYTIGGNNATLATSNDGKVWKLRETLFRTTNVTIGGYFPWINQFIAAGEGKFASSTDGTNWNLYSTPFKSDRDSSVSVMPVCFVVVPSARRIIVGGTLASINVSNLTEKIIRVEDMPDRRSNHAQVTLPNGKVFLAGGQGDGNTVATTLLFDPDNQSWNVKAVVPADRKNCGLSYIPDTATASNWTPRSSKFGLSTIRDFEYLPDADKFIAVGDLGRISESKYGLTWSLAESPFPVHSLINAVYNANTDKFTILSNATPDIEVVATYSVNDGLNWTQSSIGFPSNKLVGDFNYFPRKSPDLLMMGAHVPISATTFPLESLPELETAYGIRPNLPTVSRTSNILDWNTDDITTETGISQRSVYDAKFSTKLNRYYAAVDGGVVYSDDGENWRFGGWLDPAFNASIGGGSEVERETPINDVDPFVPWVAVDEGAGILLAVRADGVVLRSADGGVTWSKGLGVSNNYELAALPTTLWTFGDHQSDNYFTRMRGDIIYLPFNQRWVASNVEGNVLHSDNEGVTWTASPVTNNAVGRSYQLLHLSEPTPSAWANANYVIFASDDGFIRFTLDGTFASNTLVQLTKGSRTDNHSSALAYYKPDDSLLVGGKSLWKMSANLGLHGVNLVTNTGSVINLAFTRGPQLRSTFVSGTLPGLTANYQITCLDGVGESRASEVLVVVVPNSTQGVGVSLSWDRVPDARGYRLYGRRSGSISLLAELAPDVTSFVDDGRKAPNVAFPRPLVDTSGLLQMHSTDFITVISYVESLGVTFVGTAFGRVAWSRDLIAWYGVLNPARTVADTLQQQAATVTVLPPYDKTIYGGMPWMTGILTRESNNLYVAVGESGNVGISINSDDWDYSIPDATVGDLRTIAYSELRDELVLGSNAGKFLTSSARTPLISSDTSVKASTANNGLSSGTYRYWMVKEVDGTYTRAGAASNPLYLANSSAPSAVMAWPRDPRVEYYRIYRQRQAGNDPLFASPDAIQFIGRLPNTVAADITFDDKWPIIANSLVFTGTGLNDLSIDSTGYTGTEIRKVTVRLSSNATPNRIQVRYDDGEYGPEVDVVDNPARIALLNGVGIYFGALTGHTVGDTWTFITRPAATNMALPVDNATAVELATDWTLSDSGLAGYQINDIEYVVDTFTAINRYVAVGSEGRMVMSDDGLTWTQLTIHDAFVDGVDLNGLGFGIVGTTTVVSVAGDDQFLALSNNFFNKTLEAAPIQGFSGAVYEVGYNPQTKLFTAVGEEAGLATSSDGRVWKMVFLDNTVADLRSVSVGDSEIFKHMVVGNYGTFLTSFDGRVFTQRDVGYTTGTINVALSNPTTTVVLAGDGGVAQCSTDGGLTYTTVNPQFGVSDVRNGVYVDSTTTFVLVGNDGKVSTSTNGSTWTARTTNTTFDLISVDVRIGTTVLLAVAANGAIFRSQDSGGTWVRLTTPTFVSDITDIAASGTTWIITTSDGKVAKSTDDGTSWTKVAINVKPFLIRKTDPNSTELVDLNTVVFGSGVFVLGGSQGDIMVSTDASGSAFVLKDSRLNGTPLQCLGFGEETFLAGGERGCLTTSFSGFSEKLMLSGGSPDSGVSQSTSYTYNITGNAWSAGPGMNGARQFHSQQTLNDGTVLVAGGIDASGNPLATTERYLPHRNIWVNDLALPYPKGFVRGETLKDGAAILTGAGPDPFNSALVLLPAIVTPSPPRLSVGPGFLQPGTYFFRLAASTVAGETIPTEPVSITLTQQSGVVIDWDPVPNAVQYYIYGRNAGAADRVQVVPAHLTSYADLGVEATSSGTFRREDNSTDSWYELAAEMPLPREGHAQSMLDAETIMVTGGYNDRRTFRLTPNPYNFVKPAVVEQIEEGLYVDIDYFDDFYIEDNP